MEGNNFLDQVGFGMESSVIDEATRDLILNGGTTSANPADIKPIVEKKEEEDGLNIEPKKTEPVKTLTADDILGDPDDEPIETPTDPAKANPNKPVDTKNTDNTFSVLTKNLTDLGIFKDRPDEKAPVTDEDFRDRWMKEKTDQVNDDMYSFLMAKHGEQGVKVFQDIFVNGVDPKDYFDKFADIQSLEGMDLTVEDNQKSIFKEAYRRQGWSEDKIEKKLQRTIDYGDLEDETKDLYEVLLTQEREQLENMAQEKALQAEAQKAQRVEYYNNISKILSDKLKEREFDGIPVTEKTANETLDYLYAEKWQLPSGEKLTDFDKDILELRKPQNHELKVKLAFLLKNKLDLSKVRAKAITKATNQLFGDLAIKEKQVKRNNILPSASFSDGL